MELTVPSVELLLKVEIDNNFVPKLRMKANQSFNFTLPNSGGDKGEFLVKLQISHKYK